MTPDTPAPAVLRWADTSAARAAATILSGVALLGAVALAVRGQAYISCVGDQQERDQIRTVAIAEVTDAERIAQRRLIANTDPANTLALRASVIAAYDATDRTRAGNPPPAPGNC